LQHGSCGRSKLVYSLGADIRSADLHRIHLESGRLNGAIGDTANLSGAYLRGADFSGAYFNGANFYDAELKGADLSGTDLSDVNLEGANLEETILKDVKNITTEELEKQARSLKGATMPDGSIHL